MGRYIDSNILDLALRRNKMAFVSGPRQVGKTTLAKSFSSQFDQFIYKNWDESEFRRLWLKSPGQLINEFKIEKINDSKILILVEIHKSKGWKQKLKGLYDTQSENLNIVVTGSARLNIFKRGGDSLLGRYLLFRLHPFSYGELLKTKNLKPEQWKSQLFNKPIITYSNEKFIQLLKYSGFPEPLFASSENILNIWHRSRVEKIIREDLRDLSRLPELSQVEMLAALLPTKVGSPLSIQSLREDLEVSHDSVNRWLDYLNQLYYFFSVKPWSKSIPRSIKKEAKIYLYDWTSDLSEGQSFENFVACHLLKACHYWTDCGEAFFDLHYLRNKEKKEIDFLITKNKKPWLCFEVKLSDTRIDKSVDKFIEYLKCPFIQIVKDPNVWFKQGHNKLLSSAHHIFYFLP